MTKTYIEKEVLEILTDNHGYIEETDVIERIRFRHKDELIKKEESRDKQLRIGYSPLTIRRRIGKLIKEGLIASIKSDKDLEKFGIYRSDRRSAVLMLIEAKSEGDYLNKIFGEFSLSNDRIDVLHLIEEAELSEDKILISPNNLTVLATKLNIKDENIRRRIIYILYKHAKNRVFPNNLNKVSLIIKKLLTELKIPMFFFITTKEQMTPQVGYRFNIYEYAVWTLGLYESPYIIGELLRIVSSIKRGDLTEINTPDGKHTYNLYPYEQNPFLREDMIAIIEKNKQRLFEAERKYRKQGNDPAADYIFQIRRRIASANKPPIQYFTPPKKN